MFNQMKIYTVHIKPGVAHTHEKPVFTKEGFNFIAFVLTFFWALYNRLWLAALLIVAVNVLLLIMLQCGVISQVDLGAIQLGLNALIGYHANDWLQSKLVKQGYILADITTGDSLLRAEQRYFERYLANAAA